MFKSMTDLVLFNFMFETKIVSVSIYLPSLIDWLRQFPSRNSRIVNLLTKIDVTQWIPRNIAETYSFLHAIHTLVHNLPAECPELSIFVQNEGPAAARIEVVIPSEVGERVVEKLFSDFENDCDMRKLKTGEADYQNHKLKVRCPRIVKKKFQVQEHAQAAAASDDDDDDDDDEEDDEASAICGDSLLYGAELCETPCAKTLHYNCMLQFLLEKDPNMPYQCPLCRRNLLKNTQTWVFKTSTTS